MKPTSKHFGKSMALFSDISFYFIYRQIANQINLISEPVENSYNIYYI